MLWIHPILQFSCMFLASYVLWLGYKRFRFAHLGDKSAAPAFNWKRHVLLGKIAHCIWLAGYALGLTFARIEWSGFGLTGAHFMVGVAMGPIILGALITGLMLQTPKGKRPKLALTHGCLNLAAYCMALFQFVSGIGVVRLFLLS